MIMLLLLYFVAATSAYTHNILLLRYENTSSLDIAFEIAIDKTKEVINNNSITFKGVKCIIPDSSSNPRYVANAVCDCLENNTVSGIVGPYTSDQALIVGYLTTTLKIPMISPSASAGILLERGDWTASLYRLTPNNREQAVAIADMIMYFGWTRAAIIYTTDIYGMSLALYLEHECKMRDIVIATSVVLKTNSSRNYIKSVLEEDLVPYEARLILLLVPKSETDAIVNEAYELDLINAETAWIVGDGSTYFMNSTTNFNKLMYKGMLGLSPYTDTVSQDILDVKRNYTARGKTFSTSSSGVYYSTLLLAKALQTISNPPTEKGCNSNWTTGGDEAIRNLNNTFYYSPLYKPDNKTGYNISFENGTIKQTRYNVMNFNGKRLVQVGEWFNKTINLTDSDIKWFGKSPPDHTAQSIRAFLRLGVNRDPPFLMYKRDRNVSCTGNDCYEGFCVDIVKYLQTQLGFEYEFVESYDGKFGSIEKNGSWNGLVRMLIDKEIHAATVGFGTSSRRESVIDFSANMLDGGVYILSKLQKEKTTNFFFLQPFAAELWYGLLIGCAVVMIIVWFMDRFSVNTKESKDVREKKMRDDPKYDEDDDDNKQHDNLPVSETIWLVFCSFLGRGGDGPYSWPSRIVLTGWWVICLVMINTYIADLAASLTVSRMETGYTSVESIMADKTITWGTVNGSVTELLLENSNIKQQRELIAQAENVDSFEQAVKQVKEDNFLFLYGAGPLEYAAGTEPCNTEVLNIPLAMFGYAFAFPQNSPYRDILNRELFKLQEKGSIVEWWQKWSSSGCSGDSSSPSIKDDNEKLINLNNLIDLMYVFVPLVALAIILFIAEWIFYGIRRKFRKNREDRRHSSHHNGRAVRPSQHDKSQHDKSQHEKSRHDTSRERDLRERPSRHERA